MIIAQPYCRDDKLAKNGKAPVVIYVKKSGHTRSKVSTDFRIEPKYFNNQSGKFKPGAGDSLKMNSRLQDICNELEGIGLAHPEYIPTEVTRLYKEGNTSEFLEYMKLEIRKDGQGGIRAKTYDNYQYTLRVLRELTDQSLPMSRLDSESLRMMEYQMKLKGFSINTRKQIFKAVRKYTLRAYKQGKLKQNPFDDFQVGSFVSADREWNTMDEIDKLKALTNDLDQVPERLRSTLVHYLHSCHCGLRMIDSRRFDPDKHVTGDFIRIMPSKSRDIKAKLLTIPLNEYAITLHSWMKSLNPLKMKISRVNSDLKELMKLASIDKHITFHCARHSFAINSLIVGVPIEVVSEWLGHTSIVTTQIYAKIVDSLSTREMQKWNNQGDRLTVLIKKNPSGKFVVEIPDMAISGSQEFETINEARLKLVDFLK